MRGRIKRPVEFSAGWRLTLEREDPVPPLREIFGDRGRPVEVEIGHGHGAYIVAAAAARPEADFLGVEWAKARHLYAAERAARRGLANARFLRRDALDLVEVHLAPGSIRAFHVYFPDPYWKRKQFGRRLITPRFVAALAAALEPGGRVLLKTDVAPRFDDMIGVFRAEPRLVECAWDPRAALEPEVESNFERKAREAGRPVARAAFERALCADAAHSAAPSAHLAPAPADRPDPGGT